MSNKWIELSYPQRALYFSETSAPHYGAYRVQLSLMVKARFDKNKLCKVVRKIKEQNPILKASFKYRNGEVLQRFRDADDVIDVIDMNTLCKEGHIFENENNIRIREEYISLNNNRLFKVIVYLYKVDSFTVTFIFHHIIIDGWSMHIFINDFLKLYFSKDLLTCFPDKKIGYDSFILEQRNNVSLNAKMKRELVYWKKMLDRNKEGFEFRQSNINNSGSFRKFRFELSQKISNELENYIVEKKVTSFIFFLSVFQILLHKYSGNSHITVFSRTIGRDLGKYKNTIGFFINPLIISSKISSMEKYDDYLNALKEQLFKLYENIDIPFELILKKLHLFKEISNYSNIMFSVDAFNEQIKNIKHKNVAKIEIDGGYSNYDLDVTITKEDKKYIVNCLHNNAKFNDEFIQNFGESYGNLIANIIPSNKKSILEYEYLPKKDLNHSRKFSAKKPNKSNLAGMFNHVVKKYPDKIAVNGINKKTFRELNNFAETIAEELCKQKIDTDAHIIIHGQQQFEIYAAMIGVIKAGYSFILCDEEIPLDMLQERIKYFNVPIVLTTLNINIKVKVINLKQLIVNNFREENNRYNRSIKSLAYIVLTSGSTRTPRGVLVSEENLLNKLSYFWDIYPFNERDIVAQRSPLVHAAAIYEILGALLKGVPITPISNNLSTNLRAFLEFVKNEKITRITMVPSLLEKILEVENYKTHFKNLKMVILLGEVIKTKTWNMATHELSHIKFVNDYGASEVTSITTYDIRNKVHVEPYMPVGKEIWNTRCYILDRFLNETPDGVEGDLYIDSLGMALGYSNNSKDTAEKFIPNAYGKIPGSRLFNSGDRAVRMQDGNIQILGRNDNVANIYGKMVNLNQIEAITEKFNGVRKAVVILKEFENKLKICLFVQLHKKSSVKTLWSFLKEKLPLHMLPKEIIPVEKFPLGKTGKIDRAFLKSIKGLNENENPICRNLSVNEKLLKKIWEAVLRKKNIKISDNFFELGGDSIIAIEIIARLQKYGFQIDLARLYKNQSIEKLAKELTSKVSETKTRKRDKERIEEFDQEQIDLLVKRISAASGTL